MSSGATSPHRSERSGGNDIGFSGFEIIDQSAGGNQPPPRKVMQVRYQCGYQVQNPPGSYGLVTTPPVWATWSEPQTPRLPMPPGGTESKSWVPLVAPPGQGDRVSNVWLLWVQVACLDGTTAHWFWTPGRGPTSGWDEGSVSEIVAHECAGLNVPIIPDHLVLTSVALTWNGTTLECGPDDLSTTTWYHGA